MSFFNELKRRNVFKVAAAYIIVGWLIMQAGDTLAPALLLPDWINSALAFFLILGFPLAIFFAWAFELTPEGIKREKDVDRTQSITAVTGQKLNLTIIALLVLTLGYFVYDKFLAQPQLTESIPAADDFQTIAVLPFVNLSEDASNEYFSDGLTEELLNMLSKITELRVAGRTSSFAFKGQHDDLRLIGEKLNVATILEGSVRKDDKRNRVRITAQLIDVDNGFHLWSETYDRKLDDIFAIQDEIAHKVAAALRVTLLGEDETRMEQAVNTEINAYDLYLQALQGLNERGYVSLNRAAAQFQQALARDPGFIPAKIGLIDTWITLAHTGSITRQEAVNRGLPIVEALLSERPNNSNARIQMAILQAFQNDTEAAEASYVAALDADPRNARGLMEFGKFLYENRQVERGVELIEAALEIEPYSVPFLWEHCKVNAYLQHPEAALRSCGRIMEVSPESPLGWYGEGLAYLNNGDLANAIHGFYKATEKDPEDYEMMSTISHFWVQLGDAGEADKWQQRADAIGAGQLFPLWSRLMLYQHREQHDLALALARQVLERNLEDRHGRNFMVRQIWAYQSARIGDYQAGLEPYRENFNWAFEQPLQPPANWQYQVADVIQIAGLMKLAEPISERPEELLNIVEASTAGLHPGWGVWGEDIQRAAVATIRGQKEEALRLLNSAWDKKWRNGWRETLIYDAIFMQLAGEPGYQELVTRFETDMERQRERAYALMEINQ